MPNQRKPGQTFIGCQVDEKLLAEIDAARGYPTRSQFVREAIAEKLRRMGFDVEEGAIFPPDRKGKGGPKVVQKVKGNNNLTVGGDFSSSSDARERKDAASPKGKRGGKGKE